MAAVNVNLCPIPKLQFNQNGVPLAGAQLFTYAAGTMNKQPTYVDSGGVAPNTNPIILDANGQCDCWLQQGLAYKLILSPSTDTDPPTNPYWTEDNIHGINDLVSTYGVDTGVANAYAVDLTPAPAALEDGQVVLFQAANTNTGASILNLNGLGAKPILAGGTALGPGGIVAGGVYELVYNAALASYLLVAQSAGVRQLGVLANTSATAANGNALETISGPGATPFALRNGIINGNFQINQRAYVSGTALTSGTYAHDRWKAGSGGCTYTFTQAANGQQITITAGSLEQVIEDANIKGGTYTLSWTGTASGSVNGGAAAASPITVTGLAASTAATVSFGTGTVGAVQFEPGPTATPFEQRPVGFELALCQRYFYSINSYNSVYAVFGLGNGQGTTAIDILVNLPVPMRSAPSVTSGGSFADDASHASGIASSWTITNISQAQPCQLLMRGACTSVTAGANVMVIANNSNTTYINFSAEL